MPYEWIATSRRDAPRAMTQPPTFAGYAEVRQTAGYAANPLFELASWERGGSVAQSDVIRERG
jgi:hypothetical protein